MLRLIKYLLSVLYPLRLKDVKLTHEELHDALDYQYRSGRTKPPVWSRAGNVMEHPAKSQSTIRERRNREIPDDVVLSIGDSIFIKCIR